MKKLAINFENVLSVQSDLKKSLNETFKYMKNAGISALDVKYERFFDNPNLYSEILIAGMTVSSVFYIGDLGLADNYTKELEVIDFCADHKIGDIMLLTKPSLNENIDIEKYLFNLKQNLRRIGNYAKIYGVRIGIENFGREDSVFSSVKNLTDILNSVKGLYLVYDSGNFFLANENPYDAFVTFKDKISRVHIKDRGISKGDGRNEQPNLSGEMTAVYPLGEGGSDVQKILNEAHDYECCLEFDFVSHNLLEDIEKSAIYYLSEEN